MNLFNKLKGERYKILSLLTGRKRDGIKTYFCRNKMNVADDEDFMRYFNKIRRNNKIFRKKGGYNRKREETL